MPRRGTPKKPLPLPDPVYQDQLVEMVVNRLLKRGKKLLAYRICYSAMELLEERSKQDPLLVVQQAIRNVTPVVEVKAKRRGGAIQQVPVPVTTARGTALAIRWILSACRGRSGRTTTSKLASELLDAYKNSGGAVRKRDEVNRMAEANRAYAPKRFTF